METARCSTEASNHRSLHSARTSLGFLTPREPVRHPRRLGAPGSTAGHGAAAVPPRPLVLLRGVGVCPSTGDLVAASSWKAPAGRSRHLLAACCPHGGVSPDVPAARRLSTNHVGSRVGCGLAAGARRTLRSQGWLAGLLLGATAPIPAVAPRAAAPEAAATATSGSAVPKDPLPHAVPPRDRPRGGERRMFGGSLVQGQAADADSQPSPLGHHTSGPRSSGGLDDPLKWKPRSSRGQQVVVSGRNERGPEPASGNSDSDASESEPPFAPAHLTRAIKNCRSPQALEMLYRRVVERSRVDVTGGSTSAPYSAGQAYASARSSISSDSSCSGSAGGGGGGLNDLHLVTILTHLAQLTAASPGGQGAGGDAGLPPRAAEFGWEVAMELGARLAVEVAEKVVPSSDHYDGGGAAGGGGGAGRSSTAGPGVLWQPRAISNAMWAAAKLRLALRASWWEGMTAQLLVAAGAPEELVAEVRGRAAVSRVMVAAAAGRDIDGGAVASVARTAVAPECGAANKSIALPAWRGTRVPFTAEAAEAVLAAGAGPSGRDLSNAVYALAIAAAAASGDTAAARDAAAITGNESSSGRRGLGWQRRLTRRLAVLGQHLLGLCTASRLQTCTAPELSSLLYGAGVLQLRPSPAWLADCYTPALLAVMPRASPQAVSSTLWALQALDPLTLPPSLAAALLEASTRIMLRTAAAQRRPATFDLGAVGLVPEETAARNAHAVARAGAGSAAADSSIPSLTPVHAARTVGAPGIGPGATTALNATGTLPLRQEDMLPAFPLDMLATVIWSVGRLSDRGALPGMVVAGPWDKMANLWLAAAVGAVARTLRAHDSAGPAAEGPAGNVVRNDGSSGGSSSGRSAAEGKEAGWGNGGVSWGRWHHQEPPASPRRPVLAPRELVALATGLSLLRVGHCPAAGSSSSGGSVGGSASSAEADWRDIWPLIYSAALRLCARPRPPAPLYGTTRRGGGGGGTDVAVALKGHRWRPSDVSELLLAAVATTATSGVRPPPQLIVALLAHMLRGLPPPPGTEVDLEEEEEEAGIVEEDCEEGMRRGRRAGGRVGGAFPRSAGDDGGGTERESLDDAVVGCIWALAQLRFQPPRDLLVALLRAFRHRVSGLSPTLLGKLLWSLAVMSPTRPLSAEAAAAPGHRRRRTGNHAVHPTTVLALARGFRMRVLRAVRRIVETAAASAAASAAVPEAVVLEPRMVVQLLWSVRQLRVPLSRQLLRRIATALVISAVQRVQQDLVRTAPTTAAATPATAAAVTAVSVSHHVRVLGSLASGLARLCRDVPLMVRGRVVSNSCHLTPRMHLRTRQVVVLQRVMWGALGEALRTCRQVQGQRQQGQRKEWKQRGRRQRQGVTLPSSRAMEDPPPAPSELLAVKDVCSLLSGVRQLQMRLPPSLAVRLLGQLGDPASSDLHRAGGSARELVSLACELSHVTRPVPAADRPMLRLPTRGGSGAPRRPLQADGDGGRGRTGASGHVLRQRGQSLVRSQWEVRRRLQLSVSPALQRAVEKLAGLATTSEAHKATVTVTVLQVTTLLRALRRLRLRPSPATVMQLLRAARPGSTVGAATGGYAAAAAGLRGGGADSDHGNRPDVSLSPRALLEVSRMASAAAGFLQLPALTSLPAATVPSPEAYDALSAVARSDEADEVGQQQGAPELASGGAAASATAAAAAAGAWLDGLAEVTARRLAAAPPAALLDQMLPVVRELAVGAGEAEWMRPAMETTVLPATFTACARALVGGGAGAPLPYISRLLDSLLLIQIASRRNGGGSSPPSAATAGGTASFSPTSFASSSSPSAPASSGTAAPEWQPQIPDELWTVVFKASYRQMLAARGRTAAVAGASGAADAAVPAAVVAAGAAPSDDGRTLAPPPQVRRSGLLYDTSASAAPALYGVYGSGGGGGGSGRQLVALAYSLARHPPSRRPPDAWMELLLLRLESDLECLTAEDCAHLCVALMRLGYVPGGAWMQRFMQQVELTRALTEKTEHRMLSEAWLGLRRFSRTGQQHQQQQV